MAAGAEVTGDVAIQEMETPVAVLDPPKTTDASTEKSVENNVHSNSKECAEPELIRAYQTERPGIQFVKPFLSLTSSTKMKLRSTSYKSGNDLLNSKPQPTSNQLKPKSQKPSSDHWIRKVLQWIREPTS